MNVEQAIKERRSIRHYTDRVPREEDIPNIIRAGAWAPSGLNNQPWKFKVVTDTREKGGLAEFTKYGRIIRDAPVAICVFLDNGAGYNRDKDVQAIGACIQDMLLQAYELGLGTCWLGEILNRKDEVHRHQADLARKMGVSRARVTQTPQYCLEFSKLPKSPFVKSLHSFDHLLCFAF